MEVQDDQFTPSAHGCIKINGVGVFDSEFVFGKGSNICTCGAQPKDEPWNRLILHALDCAIVFCPMCQLEPSPERGGDTTIQKSAG